LALLILVVTVSVFVDYFLTHKSVRQQLSHTSPSVLAVILLLYLGTVGALILINAATLRLCRVHLKTQENLLLTAYTAVINFFGPLQSGPAFRAIYLKRKHRLNLKHYAVATFMYYFFFAGFSGIFLLSGVLKWWLVPLTLLGIGIMLALTRSPFLARRLAQVDLAGWYYLAGATLLQVSLVAAIYYTELHSLSAHITLSQAIIYTGAANFALFVSLTPGAIGFRESFLVFSERLHHISGSLIVAANIIDRAMYLVLLLILALFLVITHARSRLDPADTVD
jgi:uncharacterized membrane protein YbhN (UPF0104 family)